MELVVLVSVAATDVAPAPAEVPDIPATTGAAQLYVVPAGTVPSVPLAGTTEKAVPLQTVIVWLFIAGIGLTVTATVKLDPVQLPVVGVTV